MRSGEASFAADTDRSVADEANAPGEVVHSAPAADTCSAKPSPSRFEFTAKSAARAGRIGSWHLRPGQHLAGLCQTLAARGVGHVLLPAATGAESNRPALFVADADIARVRDLFTRRPAGQAIAVYTPTGLPGFSYQQHWRTISDATSMAVLPAYLAEELLSSAVQDDEGLSTLPVRLLLLWQIYRSLYLDGDDHFSCEACGDPVLSGPKGETIRNLADQAGVNLGARLTLASLDRHLVDTGWDPPFDVLRRICPLNSWAAYKVREWEQGRAPEPPGMTVFFVRRAVFESGMERAITTLIDAGGFEIFKAIDLTEDQIKATANSMRGGNWGPGAFAVNGGPPVRLYIAFDVDPTPVPEALRCKYPQVDNGHILEAKLRIRDCIEDRLPPNRRFNPVHSTDDTGHAWDVIRMFAADDEPEFRKLIEARKAEFATDFEVVRSLTRTGLRAKIELIRYKGDLAVKKTFRHNCLRFLEREGNFMDDVSPHRPEIPPVLERGPNYLIMPYIEGKPLRRIVLGRGFPRLMSLRQVRSMAELLRFLFARGYDPIDVGPHNLLVDKSGQMKAIDFEFVHWNGAPVNSDDAACLHGIPDDFQGEWPPKALWCPQHAKCTDPWRFRWFACTGLSLDSFLHDPPAVQRAKRLVNYPVYLATKALQIQFDTLRNRVAHSVKRRLPIFTRIVRGALRSRSARATGRP